MGRKEEDEREGRRKGKEVEREKRKEKGEKKVQEIRGECGRRRRGCKVGGGGRLQHGL